MMSLRYFKSFSFHLHLYSQKTMLWTFCTQFKAYKIIFHLLFSFLELLSWDRSRAAFFVLIFVTFHPTLLHLSLKYRIVYYNS